MDLQDGNQRERRFLGWLFSLLKVGYFTLKVGYFALNAGYWYLMLIKLDFFSRVYHTAAGTLVLTSLILEPIIFFSKRKMTNIGQSAQESNFNTSSRNKRFKILFAFWFNITALCIALQIFLFNQAQWIILSIFSARSEILL